MTPRQQIAALFAQLQSEMTAARADAIAEIHHQRRATEDRWATQVWALTIAAAQHIEEIQ